MSENSFFSLISFSFFSFSFFFLLLNQIQQATQCQPWCGKSEKTKKKAKGVWAEALQYVKHKQTNKQKSIVLLLRFSMWDKKKELAKKSFFCRLLAEVSMSWFLWGCECNYEIPVVLRCEILWARQVYQEKGGVLYWIGRVTRLFSYYIIKKKNNDKIKELRTTTLSIFSKQPMLDLLVLSRFQWGTLFVA